MAGKWVAQAVYAGFNVMGKAFIQSYQRVALGVSADARARKAAGKETPIPDAKVSGPAFKAKQMTLDEARKIIDLPDVKDEAEVHPAELGQMLLKRYDALYRANSPDRGGSAYMQCKVVVARDRLNEDYAERFGRTLDGGFQAMPDEGGVTIDMDERDIRDAKKGTS